MNDFNYIQISGIQQNLIDRIVDKIIYEYFGDEDNYYIYFYKNARQDIILKIDPRCSTFNFLYVIYSIIMKYEKKCSFIRAWFVSDNKTVMGLPSNEYLMIEPAPKDYRKEHDCNLVSNQKEQCFSATKIPEEYEERYPDLMEMYQLDNSCQPSHYVSYPTAGLQPLYVMDGKMYKINPAQAIEEKEKLNEKRSKSLLADPEIYKLYQKYFNRIPKPIFEIVGMLFIYLTVGSGMMGFIAYSKTILSFSINPLWYLLGLSIIVAVSLKIQIDHNWTRIGWETIKDGIIIRFFSIISIIGIPLLAYFGTNQLVGPNIEKKHSSEGIVVSEGFLGFVELELKAPLEGKRIISGASGNDTLKVGQKHSVTYSIGCFGLPFEN